MRSSAVPGTRPLAIAHRGASDVAPENTAAAVRRAVSLGADLVEVDVRLTRDRVPVLLHDPTLSRTTDVVQRFPGRAPWRVRDLTLDEVRRLDAGSWKGQRWAHERVPTLDEVLRLLRGSQARMLLELKNPSAQPGMVEAVADVLAAPGLSDTVVVQSFDHEAMRALKAQRPDLSVGALGRPPVRELRWIAEWASQVNPPRNRLDRAFVDEVHRWGMSSLVWTVDRPAAMRRALATGADGVITNRLSVLNGVLERRAARHGDPRRTGAAAVP